MAINMHQEILDDLESEFPARIFLNGNKIVNAVSPPHWHEYIEMLFVLDGNPYVKIDSKVFEPEKNAFFFIHNGVMHATTCNAENEGTLLVILFHPSLINIGLPETMESKYILEMINVNKPRYHFFPDVGKTSLKIYEILLSLLNEFEKKVYGYELTVKGLLYQLLGQLVRKSIIENNDFSSIKNNFTNLSAAIKYIETHYTEKLTLQMVADKCHYNYYYLSRLFKSVTGSNFKDYLDFVRVREAEQLLTNTDQKISDIAYAVGFGSISCMNRVFKKIKSTSPSNYRKLI